MQCNWPPEMTESGSVNTAIIISGSPRVIVWEGVGSMFSWRLHVVRDGNSLLRNWRCPGSFRWEATL
jgi:hypothetical protein